MHVWFSIGVSLWVATLPAAAQWKWKDSRGQVVISDVPPPREIPERDVLQKPTLVLQRQATPQASAASAAPADAAAKPKVDAELEARRKKAEAEQQAKQKADEQKIAAVRADNCKRARQYAETLNSGIRMTRLNEKGEQEYLDDNQRAAEMQRARQTIESECR